MRFFRKGEVGKRFGEYFIARENYLEGPAESWNRMWNKLGTEYPRTGEKTVYQGIAK
jgi:hypothetical protein